jgi:4-aminobutyrate aminotransferase-like enzyme
VLPKIVTEIPGLKSRALAATLRRYESRNVTYIDDGFPVFWDRAEGVNVWDADGNRFLDLTSAFGVAGLGHTNPQIQNAITGQSAKLFHAMGDVHPAVEKAALCEKLSAITFERWGEGTGKTILCNSGFEAVEAALKTSLLHGGKRGVIAFQGAYHGLGYGALDAGGIPFFREPFRAQLAEFTTILPYPHCCRCPYGVREDYRIEGDPFPNCSSACLEKLQDEILKTLAQKEIGCILVEPMQGRGGEVVPPLDFLRMLRRICDEEKILLIADEIYTGLNRTGALFACDHSAVVPDIVCLGKALTSGFPLSACVGKMHVMDAWPATTGEALHTSTFLGNPLGCRMALTALELHTQPNLAEHVRERGEKFKAAFKNLRSPHVGNVRGAGLMLGLEVVAPDGTPDSALTVQIIKRGLQDGLILLAGSPQGNVLSFAPPFEITDAEIAFVAERLQEYLASLPGSIS